MKLKNIILPICFVFLLFSCEQKEENKSATKNGATSEIVKKEASQNRLYSLFSELKFFLS